MGSLIEELRSSRPKVMLPEVMLPETRVMLPEILCHVARKSWSCRRMSSLVHSNEFIPCDLHKLFLFF